MQEPCATARFAAWWGMVLRASRGPSVPPGGSEWHAREAVRPRDRPTGAAAPHLSLSCSKGPAKACTLAMPTGKRPFRCPRPPASRASRHLR